MIFYNDNNLKIRSMVEEDIVIIPKNFALQGWYRTTKQYANYYFQQENLLRKMFIAEFNNDVAGYVTLVFNAHNGPFANKNIPEICDFNVYIKYQKQGIGNKLMDVAEKEASKVSDIVSIGVGLHSGYGTAQRMYVKRGYVPDGSGIWYDDKVLEQGQACKNDDSLVLYLSKKLK